MIYNMFLTGGKEFYPPGWADDGTDLGKKMKIKSYFKFRVSGPVFYLIWIKGSVARMTRREILKYHFMSFSVHFIGFLHCFHFLVSEVLLVSKNKKK